MSGSALPPLPDLLFVLDRDHDTAECLDMLLTFSTFGINVALLLVERGVPVLSREHRGIPIVRFQEMGVRALMVGTGALDPVDKLPDPVTPVDEDQIRTLYRQVPRILHP